MAGNVNNISRSFADNVNYLAELDNQYYKIGFIKRNGINIDGSIHKGIVKLNVFDLESKEHKNTEIYSADINGNADLINFFNNMKNIIIGLYPDVSINVSVVDGTNIISDKNIDIQISSTNTILGQITVSIHQYILGDIVETPKYTLTSGSNNYIAVLPYLSQLDDSFNNAILSIGENSSEIVNVSNNINSVNTVSSSINNVNINALNINSININANNIDNINSLASIANDIDSVVSNVIPNLDEILIADENAAIATTKASEAVASALNASSSADVALAKANEASLYSDYVSSSFESINNIATLVSSDAEFANNAATLATTKANEASNSALNASASSADALTYSNSASLSASTATEKASIAITKADEASASADSALAYKEESYLNSTNSLTNATNAALSEANALNYKNSASLSESNALTYSNLAQASEVNSQLHSASALTSANNAYNSEVASAENANIASLKATEASTSALNALSSENTSVAKANEASISAANASLSEINAFNSANSADLSEANALAHKNSALASSQSASDSETSASISAASALSSANSATSSASIATTKASEALSSSDSAATSSANALISENKAEKWASEAEDVQVEPGKYSAMHWAAKAQSFVSGGAETVSYNNNISGLTSTNVKDAIDELAVDIDSKQDILVSGNNIKTVNNQSLIGSGNVDITVGSGGYAANVYLTTLTSATNENYNQISYTPEPTQTILSATVNNNTVLIEDYIFDGDVQAQFIPAGEWGFHFHRKVDNTAADTKIIFEIYKRSNTGVETVLFNVSSLSIENTSFTREDLLITKPSFVVNTTDRVGLKVYATTTRTSDVVVQLKVGDGEACYFNTPLAIRHNQLRARDEVDSHTIGSITGLQTALDSKLGLNANAATATKLATARTITLSGDISGSAVFDGSSNVDIVSTVADNSHNHTISNVTGLQTALDNKVDDSEKGSANGVATLDVNGKVTLTQIPDSVLGQLEYQGVWNFTTLPTATQKGQYWIASVSGNGYDVGDWAVWNGATFDKVDNTDAVVSVAGRTGNVVLTKSDVGLSLVDNTADSSKNVLSATKLTTTRNIALTGDVTGNINFDGSANVSIATTIAANSVALGTDTTGNYVAGATAGTGITVSGTAGEGWSPTIAIDSTVATLTGTQTLTNKTLQDSTTFIVDEIDSTKKVQFDVSGITTATTRTMTVPNVNGTLVTTGDTGTVTSTMIADGTIVNADINASAAIADTKLATISSAGKVLNSATSATNLNTVNTIVSRDATGNFAAGTITAALSGNSSTATALQTARTITVGATGKTFNGSANVSWTLAEIGAQAAGSYQPLDADLTAIAALAGTSGLLKKTAADTWTLDTNSYVTSSGVTSVTGTAPIISSGGATPAISISAATTSNAGSMSAADKTKLDGIATGATANTGTVTSIATTGAITGGTITTTGTISHSTADGFLHVPATGTTNSGKVLTAGATAGSLSWTTLPTAPVTSVAGKTGDVTLVKGDVGLSLVDNTADSSKNVLSATKLTTARTISLSGNVTGSTSFDGSGNVTLTATVVDDSHNHVITNIDGLQSILDGKLSITGKAADSNLLDGLDSSQFLRSDVADIVSGEITHTAMLITDTPADYDSSNITSMTNAPIKVPEVNVGVTNSFLPFLHQSALHSGGYRTHMNLGLYKNISEWGEGETGFYVGLGGNDSYPTEYFRLTKGGSIKHSNGYIFWHSGNDGSGSGLDADLLDGQHGSYYQNASNLNAGTIPDARISGSYTGMTNLTGTGTVDFSRFYGNATDTVTAPSFSWTTDTNTGIYQPAADQLAITTGGVQRALFNSSGITGTLNGNASTATWADTVDVNEANTSSTWYDVVWHSGDTLYSSTGVEIQGSTGSVQTTGTVNAKSGVNLGASQQASIQYNSVDNSIDFIIN